MKRFNFSNQKILALFFVLSFFLYSKISRSETIVENIQNASLILTATVEKTEKWNNREDFIIVTLKPVQVLKGSYSRPTLKLLDQKLFSNTASLFQPSKRILVFLKTLPSYTAWQQMIKQGVQFELAGKTHTLFDSPEDQKSLVSFIGDFLKLSGSGKNEAELKKFYLKTLEQSSLKALQEGLIKDFFVLEKTSVSPENLTTLSRLVQSSQISDETKITIAKKLAQIKSPEIGSTLKSFFCISPETVCLLSAESLESQHLPIPIADYIKTLDNASNSLKVGLLQILGRHQRHDTYPLFEKIIAKEKDPIRASAIIEALGEMGGTDAETLCLKYAKDPRYYVRLAVVRSLGQLKSVKGIPTLEIALKSADPSMINIAAKSLEQIGTQEALQTLEKYYERSPHGFLEPTGSQHFNLPK